MFLIQVSIITIVFLAFLCIALDKLIKKKHEKILQASREREYVINDCLLNPSNCTLLYSAHVLDKNEEFIYEEVYTTESNQYFILYVPRYIPQIGRSKSSTYIKLISEVEAKEIILSIDKDAFKELFGEPKYL